MQARTGLPANHRVLIARLAFLLVSSLSASWIQAQPARKQVPTPIVPLHPPAVYVQNINESGQAVGFFTTGPPGFINHPFRWKDGVMTDLGTLFGHTYAFGINNRGDVVGTSYDTNAPPGLSAHAFLWTDAGGMSELPSLGGSTTAVAINDAGDVIGMASAGNDFHVVLWHGPAITDISAQMPGWTSVEPRAINNAGQIVGKGIVNGVVRAFLFDHGTVTNLGTLRGGPVSEAMAINNLGWIVGVSFVPYHPPEMFPPEEQRHLFLWRDGTMTDLGTVYVSGQPTDINDLGEIVGQSGLGFAALWENGKRTDLNKLIEPLIPPNHGWLLTEAHAINNAGQVVGAALGDQGLAYRLDLNGCIDTDGDGNPDSDGDGLCDNWETDGIDIDHDGVIDLKLYDVNGDGVIDPSERADPNHKDLYVEIDWMAQHQPLLEALKRVTKSFADAPVDNPDGTTGVRLHLQVDEEALEHHDQLAFGGPPTTPDFDSVKATHFGTASERAAGHELELAAKHLVSRYALFIHNMSGEHSAGQGENPGNDLVVSLGDFASIGGHKRGNVDQQAGTFMHELGHNLGRNHGGDDRVNCKPNYLSVMNYRRAFDGLSIVGRPLDYSRQVLPTLDERDLSEPDGILGPAPSDSEKAALAGQKTSFVPPPPALVQVVPADGPIDWNHNGDAHDLHVAVDITGECDATHNPLLVGSEDWSKLRYDFKNMPDFAERAHLSLVDQPPELTFEDALSMSPDSDGDGVTNLLDNCMTVANPGQEDADGDGVGDACDNCPATFNPGQEDENGNGIGDACEGSTSDTTPPVIALSRSSEPNASGWYDAAVSLSWSLSDPESAVVSSSGCDPVTIAADTSGTTLTCSATNGAGLTRTEAVTIRVDRTPPAIACGPADGLWHTANVSVPCTAADETSGLSDPGSGAFLLSTSVADGVETSDAQTNSRTVCNGAGICSTAGPITGIRIDRAPPVVKVRDVVLPAGAGCTASIAASTVDAGSFDPYADPVSLLIDPPGPFGLGAHTVTLTATDGHGNASSATAVATIVDTTAPEVTASLTAAGTGHDGRRFRVGFAAIDACDGAPALSAVMAIPSGAASFAVAIHGRAEGNSPKVTFDVARRRIRLEGASGAVLRSLLATILARGGVPVEVGQILRFDGETNEGDDDEDDEDGDHDGGRDRFEFRFDHETLVAERAPVPQLVVTARDRAGNSATRSAVPPPTTSRD